jgi:hypothetical protein
MHLLRTLIIPVMRSSLYPLLPFISQSSRFAPYPVEAPYTWGAKISGEEFKERTEAFLARRKSR